VNDLEKKLALFIKIYSSRKDSKFWLSPCKQKCYCYLIVKRCFCQEHSFGDYKRLDANVWLSASGTLTYLLCLLFVKIIVSLQGRAEHS